ncbi:hypothetical protein L1D12_06870 [Vibrio parahaemolyticus]|uniref:hypothetical protein n=1 Tax=Vibrio parahaemolyticus TaxID=670 RepID=UPI001EFE1722|nr:hypothetical protein [Vibrio parahaemolyticus]MCG9635031.1 hypothetical protein [Vibrio parahaemolyticus]
MIIEVSGVDGSGKSTVIGALRKQINKNEKYWAYERSFKSESVRWLESISMQLGKGNRPHHTFSHQSIELLRVENLFRYRNSINDCHNQIYFFDSYIVDQLSRLIAKGVESEDAKILLDSIRAPDLSFYIKVSPELALDRMSQRPKGDSILLEEEPLEVTRLAISCLEKAQKKVVYPVYEIDGSLEPEYVEAAITDVLKKLHPEL